MNKNTYVLYDFCLLNYDKTKKVMFRFEIIYYERNFHDPDDNVGIESIEINIQFNISNYYRQNTPRVFRCSVVCSIVRPGCHPRKPCIGSPLLPIVVVSKEFPINCPKYQLKKKSLFEKFIFTSL